MACSILNILNLLYKCYITVIQVLYHCYTAIIHFNLYLYSPKSLFVQSLLLITLCQLLYKSYMIKNYLNLNILVLQSYFRCYFSPVYCCTTVILVSKNFLRLSPTYLYCSTNTLLPNISSWMCWKCYKNCSPYCSSFTCNLICIASQRKSWLHNVIAHSCVMRKDKASFLQLVYNVTVTGI